MSDDVNTHSESEISVSELVSSFALAKLAPIVVAPPVKLRENESNVLYFRCALLMLEETMRDVDKFSSFSIL